MQDLQLLAQWRTVLSCLEHLRIPRHKRHEPENSIMSRVGWHGSRSSPALLLQVSWNSNKKLLQVDGRPTLPEVEW